MNVHCINPTCEELDVVKLMNIALNEDENIVCGVCGDPLVDDAGTVVVGPIEADPLPPGPTLDERVTELEAFNEALVTALAAHDIVVE